MFHSTQALVGDCWVTTKQTVGRFVGWSPPGSPADAKKKMGDFFPKKWEKPFQNTWKGFWKSGRKKEGRVIKDVYRTTETPDTTSLSHCNGH
jgi:hypothetical protein